MTHRRFMYIALILLLAVMVALSTAGCSNEQNFGTFGYTVKIGAQPDTEQLLACRNVSRFDRGPNRIESGSHPRPGQPGTDRRFF